MSRQKEVSSIVEAVLKDGKEHSLEEIKIACVKNEIDIERYRSVLSNALHHLKALGKIEDGNARGRYRIKNIMEEKRNAGYLDEEEININWNNYVVLKPQESKRKERKITITERGEIRLNSTFAKDIPGKKIKLIFSINYKEVIVATKGKDLHTLTKAGIVTNHDIVDKLREVNAKFPVAYIVRWDDAIGGWRGNIDISSKA